jgi:hypothetical protein
MQITTIGLDLAKSVFQVHGVDAAGQAVVRKSLRRSQILPFLAKLPPCLVGVEACGTSHHWARPADREVVSGWESRNSSKKTPVHRSNQRSLERLITIVPS